MPLMEKSFAFSVACEQALCLGKNNPIILTEMIIKTVQGGKAEIGNSEWKR